MRMITSNPHPIPTKPTTSPPQTRMRRRVFGHNQSDALSSAILFRTIIQPLLELDQNRSKLKLYIGHLTALCHDRDPLILRGLTPPASYHLDDDRAAWEKELQKMTQEQLRDELEKGEKESAELQEFANAILQQIADHCPDILEQVVNALEESS
ncbi:ELKS/Rab6-interacting/CAST family member 1-like isoform X1 [Meleagris gallopavo]|uniref:ELKS/Rab6-interacting/CAST family member 1-like isoform X1 n=1 Tax=Meleagris gallopavo TaxID=9103 RepID=UPI000549B378|nr:ELKS/Rab6-interacting/CAST family member 1-like isoform X1 [Meleagris gallopavo]